MNKINMLIAISALGLAACGGGSDTSSTPTSQLRTFTLEVRIAGAADSVSLTWLGETHTVSQTTTLTASAENYASPSALQFPEAHHCQIEQQKESDLRYLLNIQCEVEKRWQLKVIATNLAQATSFKWYGEAYTLTDTLTLSHSSLSYQTPTDFVFPSTQTCSRKNMQLSPLSYQVDVECETQGSKIQIGERLPFPVSLTIDGQTEILQQSTELEFDKSLSVSDITIDEVQGPSQCDIAAIPESNDFTLTCQAFGLTEQDAQLAMLTKDGTATLLTNSQGKQVKRGIQWADNSLLFLSTYGVELLSMDNGKVTSTQVSLANATALKIIGNQAYALADTGLSILENGSWKLVTPLSDPSIPSISHSGNLISVTTQDLDGVFHVVKHTNGRSAGSNTLNSAASKSTNFGLIYGGDIDLLTFWDGSGRLGYQPALQTNPQIVDYVEDTKQVTIWRKKANEHRLTRVKEGALQTFGSLEDNQFGWVGQGATPASHLIGFKDSLFTGLYRESGQFIISQVMQNETDKLPALKAITKQTGDLIAKFNFSQGNNYRSILPIEDDLGWILLWQKPIAGELGTLWITDGDTMLKVEDNQPQTALSQFVIDYASQTLVIVRDGENKLVLERS